MVRISTKTTVEGASGALAWTVGALWASCLLPQTLGKYVPYLQQSFFFDWTPPGQSPPIPTTAQCDSIHITWDRGNAVGPNPTAPYFLQIYTSTFVVPLIVPAGDSNSDLSFDFPVPWVPGTQYEVCMFDANGYTGGCQGIYTVYPAPNFTDTSPVCRNLTYPQPNQVLGVNAQVDNGPMSQFGWVDQCTDIQLTPQNGTPPYTMTIAPALHPPFNITSNTKDAINWTVSLSYGSPFFVSLADSTGLTWQNGPLHSGGGGSPACLAQTDIATPSSSGIHSWIAAVSAVAGLIAGLILGLLGMLCFFRWQRRRRPERSSLHRKSSSMSITTPVLSHSHEPFTDHPERIQHQRGGHDGPYQIEPFVMPEREFGVRSPSRQAPDHSSGSGTLYDTGGHSRSEQPSQDHSRNLSSPQPSASLGPTSDIVPPRPLEERRTPSQVFVVHHDAGRPPVTVYTADGTEVVELPPQYVDSGRGTSGSGSGSTTSNSNAPGSGHPLQYDRRQAGPTPVKPRRVANS
ncbi:hypothetical protein BDW22DRAFT_1427790 [Trametopsis cervina]|nr:hypothetical protein BDW22DRAFT_1427790 [Trametopsis cervina]